MQEKNTTDDLKTIRPELYAKVKDLHEKMYKGPVPPIKIQAEKEPNAYIRFAVDPNKPDDIHIRKIVLTKSFIETEPEMNDDELLFIIGHELAHPYFFQKSDGAYDKTIAQLRILEKDLDGLFEDSSQLNILLAASAFVAMGSSASIFADMKNKDTDKPKPMKRRHFLGVMAGLAGMGGSSYAQIDNMTNIMSKNAEFNILNRLQKMQHSEIDTIGQDKTEPYGVTFDVAISALTKLKEKNINYRVEKNQEDQINVKEIDFRIQVLEALKTQNLEKTRSF